jgi:hypothetical protein
MSAITEQLMLRAEELSQLVEAKRQREHPDSVDRALLDKALPMIITAGLLLRATTDEFKAEMAAKGTT